MTFNLMNLMFVRSFFRTSLIQKREFVGGNLFLTTIRELFLERGSISS